MFLKKRGVILLHVAVDKVKQVLAHPARLVGNLVPRQVAVHQAVLLLTHQANHAMRTLGLVVTTTRGKGTLLFHTYGSICRLASAAKLHLLQQSANEHTFFFLFIRQKRRFLQKKRAFLKQKLRKAKLIDFFALDLRTL